MPNINVPASVDALPLSPDVAAAVAVYRTAKGLSLEADAAEENHRKQHPALEYKCRTECRTPAENEAWEAARLARHADAEYTRLVELVERTSDDWFEALYALLPVPCLSLADVRAKVEIISASGLNLTEDNLTDLLSSIVGRELPTIQTM